MIKNFDAEDGFDNIDKINAEEKKYYIGNKSEVIVFNDNDKNSQGSLLFEFIKRIRTIDLYRISVPAITLEPVSLLEKITEFSCPIIKFLETPTITNPEQRFLNILNYFLLGLMFQTRNTLFGSKPFNPILLEFFECSWNHTAPSPSTTTYISEQVSHHPPISAFYLENLVHGIVYDGYFSPSTKFKGNSLSTILGGKYRLNLIGLNETYYATMPEIVARGIIWGSSYIEINEYLTLTCEKTGYEAKIYFKSKSGNACEGKIFKNDAPVFEISGIINDKLYINPISQPKSKQLFLNVKENVSDLRIVKPLIEQQSNESRRVWHKTTVQLREKNYENATIEKNLVEERQRAKAKENLKDGKTIKPKHFEQLDNGDWVKIKATSN